MKEYTDVPQYIAVKDDDLIKLADKVNGIIMEHREDEPEILWSDDYRSAMVRYIQKVKVIPEDKDEEPCAKFVCSDCPCFEPDRRMNGEVDARSKHGDCPFSTYGRTGRDSQACENLYKLIKSGALRLQLVDGIALEEVLK